MGHAEPVFPRLLGAERQVDLELPDLVVEEVFVRLAGQSPEPRPGAGSGSPGLTGGAAEQGLVIDAVAPVRRHVRGSIDEHAQPPEQVPGPAEGGGALERRRLLRVPGRHLAPLDHGEHPLPELDVGPAVEGHIALLLPRVVATHAVGVEECPQVRGIGR